MKKQREVAVYKGEELLCMGTIKECAEQLGVKENTIRFYTYPAYKKRLNNRNNQDSREVVFLDDMEGEEE